MRPEIIDDTVDIFSLQFSTDGSVLAAGYADGTVRLYNPASGRRLQRLQHSEQQPISSLCFRPLHGANNVPVILSVSAAGQVCHWHSSRGTQIHSFYESVAEASPLSTRPLSSTSMIGKMHNEVYGVDYNIDGTHYATGGRDCTVKVYDENTNSLLYSLAEGNNETTGGHSNRIFSVKFAQHNPNIIASGGWDNTLQLWDLRVGYSVQSFHNVTVCGDSIDIYGSTMVVGSWRHDSQLQVFDLRATASPVEKPTDGGASSQDITPALLRQQAGGGIYSGAEGRQRATIGARVAILDWASSLPAASSIAEYGEAISLYSENVEAENTRRDRLLLVAKRIETATNGAVEAEDDAAVQLNASQQEQRMKQSEGPLIGDASLPWQSSLSVINEKKNPVADNPTLVYSARISKVSGIPAVVACGSGGNEAKVFNYNTGRLLAGIKLPKPGFAAAISPDSRFAAFAGAGFGIWLANMPAITASSPAAEEP